MGTDQSDLVSLHPGDEIDIYVNQDWRDAVVLATIGAEALLEYVMPSGRSALRRVPKNYRKERFVQPDPGRPYKHMSYRAIPKVWLIEIVRNGLPWWASPQQAPDLHMTPKELFLSKWPEEEWKLYAPERPSGPTTQQMWQTARTNAVVRGRI